MAKSFEARFTASVPTTAGDSLPYLPAGRHQIRCKVDGRPAVMDVEVTPAAVPELNRQLAEVSARSPHKPYFDFNHDDKEASFWPSGFVWRDGSGGSAAGVHALGEWSAAGKAAVEGKTYRGFSARAWVDDPTAKPAHIQANPDSPLNMGGLVNAPAFRQSAALWAKEMISAAETVAAAQQQTQNMPEKETAAAPAVAMEAKDAEISGLKNRVAEFEAKEKARRTSDAKAGVAAAVKRGALPPQNAELQAKWEGWCTENPDMLGALEALQGTALAGAAPLTTGSAHSAGSSGGAAIEAKEGPKRAMQALVQVLRQGQKIRDMSPVGYRQRGDLGRELSEIYAREIVDPGTGLLRPLVGGMPVRMLHEIEAADVTGTNTGASLGTLSGTLVAQRTLQLFKLTFPAITRIFTDFSDMPAQYLQAEMTRIIGLPSVQTYQGTLGSDNRPTGWTTAQNGSTTDVLITLDEHVGVPIVYDSNTLASTVRRLFDEQAPAASYVLAKYFIEKIYKLFTLANYNGYTTVSGVKVPVAYASYPVAIGDFARSTLTKIAAIFNPNEVPITDRVVLLNSPYFEQLATDPSLVTFFAGQQAPQIVTDNRLPKLAGFEPIEAPNLAAPAVTTNLVGMALHRTGVVAKTRLPNDYTTALPGASYGSVTTITDADIGISVMLVQFVNHTQGYAEWRIEVMLGAAVGDKRGGLCIVSQ